jgi:hypothetical protein
VDEKNQNARELYRSFDFVERARYTTWMIKRPTEVRAGLNSNVLIRSGRARDWPFQRQWLEANFPSHLRWNLALRLSYFEPGLRGSFRRIFGTRQAERWSAFLSGELAGGLLWNSSSLNSDRLWLGLKQQFASDTIPALIAHAQQVLRQQRPILLDYPAGKSQDAFKAAGLQAARTLIWMRLQD